jgi:DNA-binding GntR family transcriptional regulator
MSVATQFKHRNLPDQVADHIVILLAKGELQPGQRVFENKICDLLGVSRVPVREALRILQAQGVVRVEPNRGTFMSEFGPEEIVEFLKVRISVEKIALRRLARLAKSNPDMLQTLEAAIETMRRAAKAGDKLGSCQADLEFHRRIVELSRSPMLMPIWQTLARGILVYFMQERQEYYDYERSIDDHSILLDCIRTGKASALDSTIERHVIENALKSGQGSKVRASELLKTP